MSLNHKSLFKAKTESDQEAEYELNDTTVTVLNSCHSTQFVIIKPELFKHEEFYLFDGLHRFC